MILCVLMLISSIPLVASAASVSKVTFSNFPTTVTTGTSLASYDPVSWTDTADVEYFWYLDISRKIDQNNEEWVTSYYPMQFKDKILKYYRGYSESTLTNFNAKAPSTFTNDYVFAFCAVAMPKGSATFSDSLSLTVNYKDGTEYTEEADPEDVSWYQQLDVIAANQDQKILTVTFANTPLSVKLGTKVASYSPVSWASTVSTDYCWYIEQYDKATEDFVARYVPSAYTDKIAGFLELDADDIRFDCAEFSSEFSDDYEYIFYPTAIPKKGYVFTEITEYTVSFTDGTSISDLIGDGNKSGVSFGVPLELDKAGVEIKTTKSVSFANFPTSIEKDTKIASYNPVSWADTEDLEYFWYIEEFSADGKKKTATYVPNAFYEKALKYWDGYSDSDLDAMKEDFSDTMTSDHVYRFYGVALIKDKCKFDDKVTLNVTYSDKTTFTHVYSDCSKEIEFTWGKYLSVPGGTTPVDPQPVDPPVPGDINFIDVTKDKWFYEDVKYAFNNGLMKGTGTYTFSPDEPTSRGMIVTILYRLENSPAVSGKCTFPDVKKGYYCEDAVIWASSNNIVLGYSNGKFGPDDPITREQMATLLYRYAQFKGYNVSQRTSLAKFSDSSKISSYAVDYVSWANAVGFLSGTSTTTISPEGMAQRSQAAALFRRFIEKYSK